MKKYIAFFSLSIALFSVGCAGSSKYMSKATPVYEPSADKVLVYFMRPSGIGFPNDFQIWDSERLIGVSLAKCYFAYECDPGTHLFIGIAENKRGVLANLEAGKIYYIIIQVNTGYMKARMAFIPVTRDSQYWDKVIEYEKTLNFVSPEKELLAEWVDKRQAHVDKELHEIISYFNTQEGSAYVVKLNKEDGK